MQFLLASSTQRTGEFAKVDISLSMCTQKGVHQARHKWVLAVKERKRVLMKIIMQYIIKGVMKLIMK